MSENKTQPTDVSVESFIDAVPDDARRSDARIVAALMARISGEPATMWGPSIVGFGTYRYRYESGREGDAPRIGFAPRKAETVLYGLGPMREPELFARLGTHRTGKGCVYVKRLSDIDMAVLEQLVAAGLAHSRETYPEA